MLFNTFQFAIFFIIVYGFYLLLDHKWQNRMLLAASYVFYGAWDWRFLFLIFISTVLDYICGIKIYENKDIKKRRLFLFFSIFGNLSILGFFKYFDFFASNLQFLISRLGFSIQPHFLHIILPVGISFYTFQTMSYTIDIYRGEINPTRRFLDFALFVAFFPQLVAGPIERAKRLLPQILSPRKLTLDKFYKGCYLILWGLFMKVFVADNLSRIVDPVFAGSNPYRGGEVLLALYAFSFQILCDFAGYSNIARGLGKCMGFDIMVNFNLPYFATNPREFWKRWHISLSSWLRDYLYIALGGNRKGSLMTYRNLAIAMLLDGLWHGASWTFVLWGAYQGILLITYRLLEPLLKRIPSPKSVLTKNVWFFIRVIFFFHLTCVGWLLFRANSLTQAIEMFKSIFSNFYFTGYMSILIPLLFYLWLLWLIQIFQFRTKNLFFIFNTPFWIRSTFYLFIFYLMLGFGARDAYKFIYFQF